MKKIALLIAGLALLSLPHLASAQCPYGQKLGADLRVTSAPNESQIPSLSWTGSEFGVSWFDYRDGNWEIYFSRVSSSRRQDRRRPPGHQRPEYKRIALPFLDRQ